MSIVERLRKHNPPYGTNLADEAADEIERYQSIRDLCVKALVLATGKSKAAIEEAPYTCAVEHSKDVARLTAERDELFRTNDDLALTFARLTADNKKLREHVQNFVGYDTDDDMKNHKGWVSAWICKGQLRAARAALEQVKSK